MSSKPSKRVDWEYIRGRQSVVYEKEEKQRLLSAFSHILRYRQEHGSKSPILTKYHGICRTLYTMFRVKTGKRSKKVASQMENTKKPRNSVISRLRGPRIGIRSPRTYTAVPQYIDASQDVQLEDHLDSDNGTPQLKYAPDSLAYSISVGMIILLFCTLTSMFLFTNVRSTQKQHISLIDKQPLEDALFYQNYNAMVVGKYLNSGKIRDFPILSTFTASVDSSNVIGIIADYGTPSVMQNHTQDHFLRSLDINLQPSSLKRSAAANWLDTVMLLPGDHVYPRGQSYNNTQLEQYISPMVKRGVTLVSILGNHDYAADSMIPIFNSSLYMPRPFYYVDIALQKTLAEPYTTPFQRWIAQDTTLQNCAEHQYSNGNTDTLLEHELRNNRVGPVFTHTQSQRQLQLLHGKQKPHRKQRTPVPFSHFPDPQLSFEYFRGYLDYFYESQNLPYDPVALDQKSQWDNVLRVIGGSIKGYENMDCLHQEEGLLQVALVDSLVDNYCTHPDLPIPAGLLPFFKENVCHVHQQPKLSTSTSDLTYKPLLLPYRDALTLGRVALTRQFNTSLDFSEVYVEQSEVQFDGYSLQSFLHTPVIINSQEYTSSIYLDKIHTVYTQLIQFLLLEHQSKDATHLQVQTYLKYLTSHLLSETEHTCLQDQVIPLIQQYIDTGIIKFDNNLRKEEFFQNVQDACSVAGEVAFVYTTLLLYQDWTIEYPAHQEYKQQPVWLQSRIRIFQARKQITWATYVSATTAKEGKEVAVLAHHPLLSTGIHASHLSVYHQISAVLPHVNVWVCGHDHQLVHATLEQPNGHAVVVIQSGAGGYKPNNYPPFPLPSLISNTRIVYNHFDAPYLAPTGTVEQAAGFWMTGNVEERVPDLIAPESMVLATADPATACEINYYTRLLVCPSLQAEPCDKAAYGRIEEAHEDKLDCNTPKGTTQALIVGTGYVVMETNTHTMTFTFLANTPPEKGYALHNTLPNNTTNQHKVHMVTVTINNNS